jgi:hypothetical protein
MTMTTMTTNQIAIAPGTTGSPDLLGYFVFAEQIVANFRLPYATTGRATAGAEEAATLRRELIERVRSGDSGFDLDALARVDQDLWGMPEQQ